MKKTFSNRGGRENFLLEENQGSFKVSLVEKSPVGSYLTGDERCQSMSGWTPIPDDRETGRALSEMVAHAIKSLPPPPNFASEREARLEEEIKVWERAAALSGYNPSRGKNPSPWDWEEQLKKRTTA